MKSILKSKLDFVLITNILMLIGVGLVAVYSATYNVELRTSTYFTKQLFFSITGLCIMLFTAFLPSRFLLRTTYLFYGITILLLVLVYFIGVKGFGAERWLNVGPIKLQPSELAKIATILTVARYLSNHHNNINQLRHQLVVAAIIVLPFILIARQPDLGTSLVFLVLLVPLYYWAGMHWFSLFVILSPLLTVLTSFNFYAFLIWMIIFLTVLALSRKNLYLLVTIFVFHILVGIFTPQLWGQLKPYQQKRILTFANPEADPRGAGYQIIQSKVAIGSGGIRGKGYLKGSQTQLRFLPAQHTDFIFSVIAEEWGLMGSGFVLFLFLVLILYLIYLASSMKSLYASIAIIGFATMTAFHIFVNIGMTVGLAPVTGLPLPFISYGGSFLLVNLLMMGYILNFARKRYEI